MYLIQKLNPAASTEVDDVDDVDYYPTAVVGNTTETNPTPDRGTTGLSAVTNSSITIDPAPFLGTPSNTPPRREVPTCPRSMRDNIQHTQRLSGVLSTRHGRSRGMVWPTTQRWIRPDGPYGGSRGLGGRGAKWWPQSKQPQSTKRVESMVVAQPRPTLPGTAQSNGVAEEVRRDVAVDDLLVNFGGVTVGRQILPGTAESNGLEVEVRRDVPVDDLVVALRRMRFGRQTLLRTAQPKEPGVEVRRDVAVDDDLVLNFGGMTVGNRQHQASEF